jgi:hypothetical protein
VAKQAVEAKVLASTRDEIARRLTPAAA